MASRLRGTEPGAGGARLTVIDCGQPRPRRFCPPALARNGARRRRACFQAKGLAKGLPP